MQVSLLNSFPQCLFPETHLLIPGLAEVYELHLAWLEAQALAESQLVEQAAYFWSINGQPTRHFLTCIGETLKLPDYSSSRLKSFFTKNSFRTGYATHGLFPYRGKFHPQMVRGILNAIGIGAGDTVLDPMMGSGTTLIEASLLGAQAIGFDQSPFCAFMTETKASGLTMSLTRARRAFDQLDTTFAYFAQRLGVARQGQGKKNLKDNKLEQIMDEGADYVVSGRRFRDQESAETYALLLLAFLDAMGYAERSQRKPAIELFRGILERYLHCCGKFQTLRSAQGFNLGGVIAKQGDARAMEIPNGTIDGILFSPPYSFAIDYLGNDAFHLAALGADMSELANNMIGLRGGPRLAEKYALYLEDMQSVLNECYRVLKPDRYCVIVVGTNNNQLGKVLKVSPDEVTGLNLILRSQAEAARFTFINEMPRSIKGMANTMREEFIIFLHKG